VGTGVSVGVPTGELVGTGVSVAGQLPGFPTQRVGVGTGVSVGAGGTVEVGAGAPAGVPWSLGPRPVVK
jgi:hypothetical protein